MTMTIANQILELESFSKILIAANSNGIMRGWYIREFEYVLFEDGSEIRFYPNGEISAYNDTEANIELVKEAFEHYENTGSFYGM